MRAALDAIKVLRFAAIAADGPGLSHAHRKLELPAYWSELAAWGLAAMLLIAAGSYWVGMHSFSAGEASEQQLPVPARAGSTAEAAPSKSQDVTYVSSVASRIAPPAVPPPTAPTPVREEKPAIATSESKIDSTHTQAAAPAQTGQASGSTTQPARVPAEQATGAAFHGFVRIGRFVTASDAKEAWDGGLHQLPGIEHQAAVPVAIKSLRDGQTYYRLQVGTSSRERSEALCQRVHDMDQSCTVFGPETARADSGI